MSSPKILVFGSTGNIGIEVAKALSKRNVPFRAIIHKSADKLKGLNNCEIVEVDLYNIETVSKALKGIEKVFLMTPPGQTFVGHQLISKFSDAGVKHIVKLSALGAEEKDPKTFRWASEHAALEVELKKAGIAVTSLRPSSFFSNIFVDLPTIKGKNSVYKADGDAKINWISNEDIGEVAAVALTSPGHEGKDYYLTGPDNLSWDEFATLWSEVLGRKINSVHIDDAQLRENSKSHFPNPTLLDQFSNMHTYFRNGGYDKKFDDVERVLGRKPQSIRPYLEAAKQAFL